MTTPADQPPAWVADAVFYQIFPDRFAVSTRVQKPSNLQAWDEPPHPHAYKGGDLLGVVEKLDYLQDLGITALYLNPIFQSAANHRYHTHDYYRIDPLLGGDAAFDELLGACHDRGMRVVVDGVFNHASRGFFQFSDIAENHDHSPWRDWFRVTEHPLRPYTEDVPPGYEAWWNLHALPKFNTENGEVREFLMQVAEHWIRRGADGWRLDVPKEIKTEGFWEEFRARVRGVNPNAYLVGEIWETAPDWMNTRFDGLMHYQLGTAIVAYASGGTLDDSLELSNPHYTITGSPDAAATAQRINEIMASYSPETNQAHLVLLDSHDTARVTSILRHDGGAMALAALMLMAMPGAPCLYYGTEIGLEGALDPDNRRAFPWDESRWDTAIRKTWKAAIALRHEHAALRSADITAAASGSILLLTRRSGDEELVVTINATHETASTDVRHASGDRIWGPPDATLSGGSLTLPARTGAVWTVEK